MMRKCNEDRKEEGNNKTQVVCTRRKNGTEERRLLLSKKYLACFVLYVCTYESLSIGWDIIWKMVALLVVREE